MEGHICRASGGDERTKGDSLGSLTSVLVSKNQRDCKGAMKMHSFPQQAHSPIWLCVYTFLLLCTVVCFCAVMDCCIAYFHRNASVLMVTRCVCGAPHNIPWHSHWLLKLPFFKSTN